MSRNQEKAQSMLYRFGRPRPQSLGWGLGQIVARVWPARAGVYESVSDGEANCCEKSAEKWPKFKTVRLSGLSDYETRDLNDEINKLMREKRHWESQIVALGGANYRRNVTMLDDDGKEVPGTKGYKHFGRAKDLPGVRELFRSRKTSEDEDNAALVCYKKILGQGPAYYGDVDDMDGPLLEFEHHAEEGDWEDVCSNLREALGLPAKSILFAIPRQPPYVASISPDAAHTGTKRKITDSDADMLSSLGVKRAKADSPSEADQTLVHARAAVSHIPLLTVENLLPPKLPTHTEMEAVLLALRKKALVEEYFGDGE